MTDFNSTTAAMYILMYEYISPVFLIWCYCWRAVE